MHSDLSASRVKGVNGKVKKRVKPPPARARRRLIDPTKWDSVYLKGVFLDTVSVHLPTPKDSPEPPGPVKYDIMDGEDEEEIEEDGSDSDAVSSVVWKENKLSQRVPELAQDRARATPSAQRSQETVLAISSRMHEATESNDVRDEANAALAILGEMFGDIEDWDGRESVTELEDLEDNEAMGKEMQMDEREDIEFVPRDFRVGEGGKVPKKDKGKGKEQSMGEVRLGQEDVVDLEVTRDTDVEMDGPPVSIEVSAQTTEPTVQTNLKALFAPREEGSSDLFPPCHIAGESFVFPASFSLLDHLDLDLDLELDADILGIGASSGASREKGHPSEPILPTLHVTQIPATISTTKAHSRVTLDPSLPLLFPLPHSLPHPYTPCSNPTTTIPQHGTPTCFLFPSATRVRGLHHLPPSITFTRSPQDTSETIRERWEKDKSSLTREWKKAWREARGSRRGKVGAGGEVGGGY